MLGQLFFQVKLKKSVTNNFQLDSSIDLSEG